MESGVKPSWPRAQFAESTPKGATMDIMSRCDRATFRLPTAALFFPVLLMFCITPLATSGGAWWIAFIVPALALAWVIVTKTTATPARISAYGLFGARRMTWTEMDGLEFRHSQWAIAVGHDGRRLRLPMVRPRDLPRLAAVSGGSLNLGHQGQEQGPAVPNRPDQTADVRSAAQPASPLVPTPEART